MGSKKIRSLIIDDDQSNVTNLEILIGTYCPEVEIVGSAMSVEKAIIEIKKESPNLLFLDVEIKNKTGFDILEKVDCSKFNVIFVTAYDKYAIRALRFSAVDYLLKPIAIDELEAAVHKVSERLMEPNSFKGLENLINNMRKGTDNPKIALPMNGSIEFVNISDIIRCLGESAYTTFFLNNGKKILVSKTLKEYEELLSEHNFLRVHKSHLINMNYAKTFVRSSDSHIVMKDGSTVSVSNLKKQEILKKLKSLILGMSVL